MVAVAPLAVVIVALLAVLLYYALKQLTTALANILPDWSFPGLGSLRNHVIGAAESAWNAISGWLDSMMRPVVHILAYPVHVARSLIDAVLGTVQSIFNTLAVIVTVKIPHALALAIGTAQHLYNLAVAYASNLVHALAATVELRYRQAIGWADHIYNLAVAYTAEAVHALAAVVELRYQQAVSWADHIYNLAVGYAASIVHTLAVHVEALYVSALHYADALVGTLAVHVEALYQSALRYAEAAAKAAALGVLSTLNGAASIAIAQIWPALITDIDKLAATAATDFTDVVDDLRAATQAVPRDIAGALALSTAISIPLIKMVERCVIPNCRNVSQFGRDLQDILGLVGGIELTVMLAEMVRDPNGAADTLHGFIVDPIHSISHGVESLIGL